MNLLMLLIVCKFYANHWKVLHGEKRVQASQKKRAASPLFSRLAAGIGGCVLRGEPGMNSRQRQSGDESPQSKVPNYFLLILLIVAKVSLATWNQYF